MSWQTSLRKLMSAGSRAGRLTGREAVDIDIAITRISPTDLVRQMREDGQQIRSQDISEVRELYIAGRMSRGDSPGDAARRADSYMERLENARRAGVPPRGASAGHQADTARPATSAADEARVAEQARATEQAAQATARSQSHARTASSLEPDLTPSGWLPSSARDDVQSMVDNMMQNGHHSTHPSAIRSDDPAEVMAAIARGDNIHPDSLRALPDNVDAVRVAQREADSAGTAALNNEQAARFAPQAIDDVADSAPDIGRFVDDMAEPVPPRMGTPETTAGPRFNSGEDPSGSTSDPLATLREALAGSTRRNRTTYVSPEQAQEAVASAADRIAGRLNSPSRTVGENVERRFTELFGIIDEALPQTGWRRGDDIPLNRTPQQTLDAMRRGDPVSEGDVETLSDTLNTIAHGMDSNGSALGSLATAGLNKIPFVNIPNSAATGAREAFSSNNITRIMNGTPVDDVTARSWYQKKRFIIPAALTGGFLVPQGLAPLVDDENPETTTAAESIVDAARMPGYFATEVLTDYSSLNLLVDWEIAGYKVDPLTENTDMRLLLDPSQRGIALDSNQRAALSTQLGLSEGAELTDIQLAASRRLTQTTARGFGEEGQTYRDELFSRYALGSSGELALREFEIKALAEYITPRIPGPAQDLPEAGRIEFVRMYGYDDAAPEARQEATRYRQQILENGPNPLQRQVLATVDEVIANERQRGAESEQRNYEEASAGAAVSAPANIDMMGRNRGRNSTPPPTTSGGASSTSNSGPIDEARLTRIFSELEGLVGRTDLTALRTAWENSNGGDNSVNSPAELQDLQNRVQQIGNPIISSKISTLQL